MSNEEFLIHQDEHRKACINQLLKSKLGDNILTDQIKSDTWTERLLRSPPASIDCDKLDKIMVVEDNDLNRKLFCDVLRANGFEVEPVADGHKVLETARAISPDLIIMDIHRMLDGGGGAERAAA